ncbi:MAG: TIGR01777 family protein, partial [Flavobacteriales bacterium]
MKILITGATGLIGSEITSQCHQHNLSVHYLTTSTDKLVSNENHKGFYWNPTTGEIDGKCFEGVTAIINLAGASISRRWTKKYKAEILNSRINALRTLNEGLKHIDTRKIKSFVSASAIGIYPNSLSNYYEETETGVDDSFLGEVVKRWEKEADTFESYGFSVSKIRIGLVMASDGGALPEIAKPIKYGLGAAFGAGTQWQSWIHIGDLARMFLYVIENQLKGVYNGVGPNPVTNLKLTKELARVMNKPLILPNIPKFVMQTALGEMSYILFNSQRVSSKKIEEEGFVFGYQNICRA